MKVAINSEIGGFSLPIEVIKRIGELMGLELFFYELITCDPDTKLEWARIDDINNYQYTFKASRNDLGEYTSWRELHSKKNKFNDDMEFPRTDKFLIQALEELKDITPKIKIVEIPNDVKYYIHESDMGDESIHEVHRIWY